MKSRQDFCFGKDTSLNIADIFFGSREALLAAVWFVPLWNEQIALDAAIGQLEAINLPWPSAIVYTQRCPAAEP